MSGRIGTCINCNETSMGIYTMDVTRGWSDDRFNFNVEICEKCVEVITKGWKLGEMTADIVYVFARKNEMSLDEIKDNLLSYNMKTQDCDFLIKQMIQLIDLLKKSQTK